MIFIDCKNEEIIQVSDKTRIDVSGTFVSGDAITEIEIQPSASDSFISVFNADMEQWYLDWAYDSSGAKVISVRATDGTDTVTSTFNIECVSSADDNLYSSDNQIFQIETELKKYIPQGRNSYKNIHREAQSRIINYLDRKNINNGSTGLPYTKDELNLAGELSKWSLYESIYMIYTDLFLSGGEKFQAKMEQYRLLRNDERDRAMIRIDKDGDGNFDPKLDVAQDMKTFQMVLR